MEFNDPIIKIPTIGIILNINGNIYQVEDGWSTTHTIIDRNELKLIKHSLPPEFSPGDKVAMTVGKSQSWEIIRSIRPMYSNYSKRICYTYTVQNESRLFDQGCFRKVDHFCDWKEYIGFTDRYEYCQICDLKRN